MDIEQVKPNKPNFGLVVAIAGVVMLGIFVAAYVALHWGGRDLIPHHTAHHPTSQLQMPGTGASTPMSVSG